eukprot:354857-Chlamydomonas_euryale.AAC.53
MDAWLTPNVSSDVCARFPSFPRSATRSRLSVSTIWLRKPALRMAWARHAEQVQHHETCALDQGGVLVDVRVRRVHQVMRPMQSPVPPTGFCVGNLCCDASGRLSHIPGRERRRAWVWRPYQSIWHAVGSHARGGTPGDCPSLKSIPSGAADWPNSNAPASKIRASSHEG